MNRRLGDGVVHRQQFDRRDPEVDQVLQCRRVGQAGVCPAQVGWNVGVPHREPLDVNLVHDRIGNRGPREGVGAPVEVLVDHQSHGNAAGRVEAGHEAVPYAEVALREGQTLLTGVLGDEAQRDPVRRGADEGDAGTRLGQLNAERQRAAREHGHRVSSWKAAR
jgi:hypothetical protein